MIEDPIFFLTVGIIQMIISGTNYYLAYRCFKINEKVMGFVNILAGISWTLTSLYKFFEMFLVL